MTNNYYKNVSYNSLTSIVLQFSNIIEMYSNSSNTYKNHDLANHTKNNKKTKGNNHYLTSRINHDVSQYSNKV